MRRENAIKYLQKKRKIRKDCHPKFNKEENTKIEQVVKEGKIYGDPFVQILQ